MATEVQKVAIKRPPEGPPQFCFLSFGFTLSTLNFKFPSFIQNPPKSLFLQQKLSTISDLFMQNKANLQKVKFYITNEMKRDYTKWTLGVMGKTKPNKANSKPIKANFPAPQTARFAQFNTNELKIQRAKTCIVHRKHPLCIQSANRYKFLQISLQKYLELILKYVILVIVRVVQFTR
jgi:hypothetical protein